MDPDVKHLRTETLPELREHLAAFKRAREKDGTIANRAFLGALLKAVDMIERAVFADASRGVRREGDAELLTDLHLFRDEVDETLSALPLVFAEPVWGEGSLSLN